MSSQMSLWDTPNVISSPELESGALRSEMPDGQTISQSGRQAALANLSARQAKEKGLLTSGTYGRLYTTSSVSADLRQLLESRFRASVDLNGSILYRLTWKYRATPWGRLIPALRGSPVSIYGSDCTGWPTPAARDYRSEKASQEFTKSRLKQKRGKPLSQIAGWATPTATDAKRGVKPPRPWDTGIPLTQQVGKLLVDAYPGRVEQVRAYGNSLDAEQAKEFVKSVMWSLPNLGKTEGAF